MKAIAQMVAALAIAFTLLKVGAAVERKVRMSALMNCVEAAVRIPDTFSSQVEKEHCEREWRDVRFFALPVKEGP
jgi:hypothetical protein